MLVTDDRGQPSKYVGGNFEYIHYVQVVDF
jgi:hypothetical protein